MSCYHPLKGWPVGTTPAGKQALKITSYDIDHIEYVDGQWLLCTWPYKATYAKRIVSEPVLIPCGQCLGCRLDYSRQWANRCLLELGYHDSAWFLTLTYDPEHVPKVDYVDDATGEVFTHLTLVKRDFQLFMKRLRKAFPEDKIRFYAAGEYGSETLRPHYHAIVYGLHLDDLQVYQKNLDMKYDLYASNKLDSIWKNGNVIVGHVTWETCAYTARYVTKKLNGKAAKFYQETGIEREFSLMSRKPGIGAQYFVDHPDVMDYTYINVPTPDGGKKFRPPKYFDRLFEREHEEEFAEMKAQRKEIAEAAAIIKSDQTSLSYAELLEVEERNKEAATKMLKRGVI